MMMPRVSQLQPDEVLEYRTWSGKLFATTTTPGRRAVRWPAPWQSRFQPRSGGRRLKVPRSQLRTR